MGDITARMKHAQQKILFLTVSRVLEVSRLKSMTSIGAGLSLPTIISKGKLEHFSASSIKFLTKKCLKYQ
jgi:hypothetical protein